MTGFMALFAIAAVIVVVVVSVTCSPVWTLAVTAAACVADIVLCMWI